MKKAFLTISIIIILSFILSATAAARSEWYLSSDEQTADAVIVSGIGVFRGVWVATDGTNAVTISIYNNATTNTGIELIPTTVITSATNDRAQGVFLPFNVRYDKGIYVDITTSGTVKYVVYYREN